MGSNEGQANLAPPQLTQAQVEELFECPCAEKEKEMDRVKEKKGNFTSGRSPN